MFQGMEYIYTVYQEKSFSKAARKLFISQPSLSATVKRVVHVDDVIGSVIFNIGSHKRCSGLNRVVKKWIVEKFIE